MGVRTRDAELRARLGWEIKEAQLKRKTAISEVGVREDPGLLRKLEIAKAFWEGFEEGLKRSLLMLGRTHG